MCVTRLGASQAAAIRFMLSRPPRPATRQCGGMGISSVHHLPLPAPNAKVPEQVRAYSRCVANALQAADDTRRLDVVEFAEWAAEGLAFVRRPHQVMVTRTHTPSWVVRDFEMRRQASTNM